MGPTRKMEIFLEEISMLGKAILLKQQSRCKAFRKRNLTFLTFRRKALNSAKNPFKKREVEIEKWKEYSFKIGFEF